jgi:hypothetical protein
MLSAVRSGATNEVEARRGMQSRDEDAITEKPAFMGPWPRFYGAMSLDFATAVPWLRSG